MTELSEIFSPVLFKDMIEQGYIRVQTHPTEKLSIANYTEKAQFAREWNAATIACRGLIYRTDTKEVVARPFAKFWNYGESQNSHLYTRLSDRVEVTDKKDGSLGILYPTANGLAIATRGSFTSDQAKHATVVWKDRYERIFQPRDGFTYLFEIVYPENRIVLDYGSLDDLILIGVVNIETGRSVPHLAEWSDWPGPITEVLEYPTLGDALLASPRDNAEGVVVHFPITDERVKIKQEDYVALHRIITGLSKRSVWQHIMDGKPLSEMITALPDEFHQWVVDVSFELHKRVYEEQSAITTEFNQILSELPADFSRRDFAQKAVPSENKWALFLLLDGRSIAQELLKRAKPEPTSIHGTACSEDTA